MQESGDDAEVWEDWVSKERRILKRGGGQWRNARFGRKEVGECRSRTYEKKVSLQLSIRQC
jgi:hypothetical protein